MAESYVGLKATSQPDHRDALLVNRENFALNVLDPAWISMSSKIEDFKPDIVISPARKMTRLVGLLQSMPQHVFRHPARYISDLAIGFMRDEIKNARIAILDDAINVGSTLDHILRRVDACEPQDAQCFVMLQKKDGGAGFKSHDRLSHIHPANVDDHQYKAAATRISQSLWALNRPLEVEFPVFVGKSASISSLSDLERKVARFSESAALCHALNISEAPYLGLQRYSIELNPSDGFNEKIRLYVDVAEKELVVVPMAYSWDEHADHEDRIRRRFIDSMRLGRRFMDFVFADCDLEFAEDEAALLFGAKEAHTMHETWLQNQFESEPERRISTTFYENDWPEIAKRCSIRNRHFLNECFTGFFLAAADYYEADSGTDYERLCKGPTFSELRMVMNELWDIDETRKSGLLVSRLGALLDEHIDNGFVVPTTDKAGRRVFRKGEPYPYQRKTLEILKFIYGEIDPAEDVEKEIERLPDADKDRFERIILSMELREECAR